MMGTGAGLLVLELLAQREMYGYQIIAELAERSENAFRMQEGTLYPLLHAMEQDGYVTARVQVTNGRPRRYYRITDAGRAQLQDKLAQWDMVDRMIQSLRTPQEQEA